MKLFKGANGEVLELIYPADEAVEVVVNGQPAAELKAGSTDAATEKHVPAVKAVDGKLEVQVGEIAHPMLDNHYITNIWVEYPDGTVEKKTLKPGEAPNTEFDITDVNGKVTVYEYCNLHGLWKKEIEL